MEFLYCLLTSKRRLYVLRVRKELRPAASWMVMIISSYSGKTRINAFDNPNCLRWDLMDHSVSGISITHMYIGFGLLGSVPILLSKNEPTGIGISICYLNVNSSEHIHLCDVSIVHA